jgi:hypothetical protein
MSLEVELALVLYLNVYRWVADRSSRMANGPRKRDWGRVQNVAWGSGKGGDD